MSARPLFRLSRSYAAQSDDRRWLSPKNFVWLLFVLAAGFFVRLYGLAAQSLWNDEGTSVALARTSLPAIIVSAAHDIHPPLYYLLLHVWIQAAGISEFALRFGSVIAGVLVVGFTFRIAREFFDQEVALLAAVLSALNPFQTYYAQETRMYIWVTLFATLSVWMMVLVLKPARAQIPLADAIRRRTVALILYAIFTLAALYTNYYAFTLVLVENLSFGAWLVWAWRRSRTNIKHTLVFWVGAQFLIGLLYLPWLLFARASLMAWPGISEPLAFWDMAWRIHSAFITGADVLHDTYWLLALIYLLCFVSGFVPSRDLFRQSAWGILTCALWALVPLSLMYLVSLVRPAYNPKFLLLATPGFIILVARGVSILYPGLFLRERAPYAYSAGSMVKHVGKPLVGMFKLLGGAAFAAGIILALQGMYTDPRLQRDDYRGILRYINAVATANDAVIVEAPGQIDVVRYYFHSAAALQTLPIGRPLQPGPTEAALLDTLTHHDKLFAIYWATDQADPDRFVERSLSEVSYEASDIWHGNVRLAEYAIEPAPREFEAKLPFGRELYLRRFAVGDKPLSGGDILALELVWVRAYAPQTDYKVFVHLLDGQGRIVAQHDGEPQAGFAPTSHWQSGQEISDKIGLPIPVGTPPGEYAIELGVYRGDTGERLRLKDGEDHVVLGSITVGKRLAPRAAVPVTLVTTRGFGAVELFGYNLVRSDLARGEFVPIVLYWQARDRPSTDAKILVQLRDQGSNVIASARAFESYPSSRWDKDEIVRDVQTLTIPGNALPGEYQIVITDGTQTSEVTHIQVR